MDNQKEKKFYASLPKKRMGAGALFFNDKRELLILKPNYKKYWLLPGGVVEQDESPLQGCIREVKEEIGLDIKINQLLCVCYQTNKGIKSESLHFFFWGGILNKKQIEKIKLQEKEIDECQFLKIDKALNLLNQTSKVKVKASIKALKNNSVVYLEIK